MTMIRIAMAVLALQLTASVTSATTPANSADLQVVLRCGDDMVDIGEQCDGTADSACPGLCSTACHCPPTTTIDIPSAAQPRDTPGSPGVQVTNPKLLTQLGPQANLNHARYTRFQLGEFPSIV